LFETEGFLALEEEAVIKARNQADEVFNIKPFEDMLPAMVKDGLETLVTHQQKILNTASSKADVALLNTKVDKLNERLTKFENEIRLENKEV